MDFRPGKDDRTVGYLSVLVGGVQTQQFRCSAQMVAKAGPAIGAVVVVTGRVLSRTFGAQLQTVFDPVSMEVTG